MTGTLNKVSLIGRLGADPEKRSLNSGDPVVNMRIATSDVWRDKQSGEPREKTEWHQIVIFNERLANNAAQYLRKGALVHVEGKLRTRKWSDASGAERFSTEIVLERFGGELTFLEGRSDDDRTVPERETRRNEYAEAKGRSQDQWRGDDRRALDDDIPF